VSPEELKREVLAFDPDVAIERAWTPPSSWYTAPAFYELERRSVFARGWQPVARVEQLREPGSYVAGCLAGEPWVVVRGDDGAVRGFSNVCRHKGREVVTGSGRADALVCGYHGWTYALDGRLTKAPRIAGIEAFDREAMSLPAIRTETWGPWVFANRDGDARSASEELAELGARLAARGWDRLRYVESAEWTLECNWKVYVDNYLDGGYHIPHMHPTLDAQLDMSSYRTELFERFSIQSSGAARDADDRIDFDASVRIGAGAIYAWIHPSFMINRYGPCLDTNHVVPLGPDRCRVVYEFFVDADNESEQLLRDSIAQSAVTQREDIEICESVQRGLGSSSYDRGRYAPRVEMGEHHFHRLLAEDYRRALG
jgi:choline monooxygenase